MPALIATAALPRFTLVVMGVSGSGKSTIAAAMAEALRLPYTDGDSLHSAASVAKMHAGTPLQDADRWPWLDRIGACLSDTAAAPRGMVVACSALKRAYRDRLRSASPGIRFLFLDGTEALLRSRLAHRSGHYMPGTLLKSQLQTLQRPGYDEPDVVSVNIDGAPDDIAAQALRKLRAST